MKLNAGGILTSSNVRTKAPLDPADYKQTKLDIIWIWTHVLWRLYL